MRKISPILGLVLCALSAGPAYASPIYLNVGAGGSLGDHILGEVFTHTDLDGGLATRDEALLDALRVMGLGERSGTAPEYYRSTTDFGLLPDAVQAGAVLTTPGGFTVDGDWLVVTLDDWYVYLIGAYDGPNGGAQVWYIRDIAPGTPIYIPFTAEPSGTPRNLIDSNRYQATSWSAFNPVPDGGATSALLGLALLGFGIVRRFVR